MNGNRYADLLRVVAIGAVVYGHWMLTDVTYQHGQLSGLDALNYVSWGRWDTLALQVMPVFFLVGGYVNAQSWAAHHARGEAWTRWVRDRAMRLLWPTTVFVAVAVLAVAAASLAGVGAAELVEGGWLVALQLWFLPVYLLLIVLTPVMLAAHRRWGLAVPAVMAVAAGAVEAAVLGPHWHFVGYANYLLVWGSMHQWGFAWQDGTLTRRRWRPLALAVGGTLALAGLLTWGPFPVDMIGAGGETVTNTGPPSIALLAFAAAQAGLVLAAEPAVSRWLARPRRWRRTQRLNASVMTVYLWHMAPALVIAVAFYPTGIMPQPAIGSAEWWLTRLAWLALLTLVLVPLVIVITWAERPMLRLPAGLGPSGWWSPAVLVAGTAAAMAGLARLAIAGFAPGGHLPALVLAAYAAGLIGMLLTGRAPPEQSPALASTSAAVIRSMTRRCGRAAHHRLRGFPLGRRSTPVLPVVSRPRRRTSRTVKSLSRTSCLRALHGEAAGVLAGRALKSLCVRLPRDAGRVRARITRVGGKFRDGQAGLPGVAGAKPLPLLRVAGTGAVPGSGVLAVRLLRMLVSGEVRRACMRPRPPRMNMTAAAMNAAIAAIPAIVPMVPKA
jgi:fucose 4-O-acetylase-like acetyltransferase